VSGLCGWTGYGASAPDNRALTEAMAVPLPRFDQAPLRAPRF
jgi:hypothetical protein